MGEKIGEFSYFDYSGEFGKWITNEIATDIKDSISLSEKTLVIGYQFVDVFSHQHFLLCGNHTSYTQLYKLLQRLMMNNVSNH